MAPELTRSCKGVVTALGLFVLAMAGAMPAMAGTSEPTAAKRTDDTAALSLDIVNGRWNFTGRNVTVLDAVREITAKTAIDVRFQDATLEKVKLGISFKGADPKEAMSSVLAGFNYSEFDDPKTKRRVYLVTSLTTEVKQTPEMRATQVASVAQAPASTRAASSAGNGKAAAKSLDEFRKVEPAQIKSREQSQAEIEAEFKREREEKLSRALDVLKSQDASGTVQQQALYDLANSGDPRATSALKDAWNQVQGNPTAASEVARQAWRHAAQLQFANAEANALLTSMASSTLPGVRGVAEAATTDMSRYLAAQKKGS